MSESRWERRERMQNLHIIFSCFSNTIIHVTRCAAVTAFCVLSRMEQKMAMMRRKLLFIDFLLFCSGGCSGQTCIILWEVCTYSQSLHWLNLEHKYSRLLSYYHTRKIDVRKVWCILIMIRSAWHQRAPGDHFAHLVLHILFFKIKFSIKRFG